MPLATVLRQKIHFNGSYWLDKIVNTSCLELAKMMSKSIFYLFHLKIYKKNMILKYLQDHNEILSTFQV